MNTAGVAGVGFLSGVDALVIVQRGEFLEAATALVATVRSFIAMIEHVFVVGLLERERFRTQIAAVWCLSYSFRYRHSIRYDSLI